MRPQQPQKPTRAAMIGSMPAPQQPQNPRKVPVSRQRPAYPMPIQRKPFALNLSPEEMRQRNYDLRQASSEKRYLFLTNYNGNDQFGDFKSMIDSGEYNNCIFFFNDDVDHLGSRESGWGSAVIRPYRNNFSFGIPTGYGYGRMNGFSKLDDYAISFIKNSIENAVLHMVARQKEVSFLSVEVDGLIGNRTYDNVGFDVKKYVMDTLGNYFEMYRVVNESSFISIWGKIIAKHASTMELPYSDLEYASTVPLPIQHSEEIEELILDASMQD